MGCFSYIHFALSISPTARSSPTDWISHPLPVCLRKKRKNPIWTTSTAPPVPRPPAHLALVRLRMTLSTRLQPRAPGVTLLHLHTAPCQLLPRALALASSSHPTRDISTPEGKMGHHHSNHRYPCWSWSH